MKIICLTGARGSGPKYINIESVDSVWEQKDTQGSYTWVLTKAGMHHAVKERATEVMEALHAYETGSEAEAWIRLLIAVKENEKAVRQDVLPMEVA